jgi:hypothetical protein
MFWASLLSEQPKIIELRWLNRQRFQLLYVPAKANHKFQSGMTSGDESFDRYYWLDEFSNPVQSSKPTARPYFTMRETASMEFGWWI